MERINNPNGANVIYWRVVKGNFEVLLQKSASRKVNSWEFSGGGTEYGKGGESFFGAARRESDEEISFVPKRKRSRMLAVLQQKRIVKRRKRVDIGVVVVFACRQNINIRELILDPKEVSAVKWWCAEEALLAKPGDLEFVSLGYRRMLAIAFNRWHAGTLQTGQPHDGDLMNPIRVNFKHKQVTYDFNV